MRPPGPTARLGLVAVTGAALPLALYWLAVRPSTLEGLERTRVRIEDKDQECRALEATLSRLQEFQADDAALREKLKVLEQIRPPEPQIEPLLDRLREVAAGYGVPLVEGTPHTGNDTARLDLRLRGPYAGLVSFVERLARLARLIRFERVEMERRLGSEFELRLQISAFYHKG